MVGFPGIYPIHPYRSSAVAAIGISIAAVRWRQLASARHFGASAVQRVAGMTLEEISAS
jgi:hypothetical protein